MSKYKYYYVFAVVGVSGFKYIDGVWEGRLETWDEIHSAKQDLIQERTSWPRDYASKCHFNTLVRL